MDERTDVLSAALAARYAATFDRGPRASAPQGIHWCLNTPEAATQALGPDGHPAHDAQIADHPGFPRRMWASSKLRFLSPIPVGAAVVRQSTVCDVVEKSGGSGKLLFVTVAHETSADGEPAVSETQTIVYREPAPGDAPPAPVPPVAPEQDWDWERTLTPGPTLLFRYSALTFNTHRIHYDLAWARDVEGYPGLVVHGPLMAALLLDLADRMAGPDALADFAFRAVAPAFADAPLRLLGKLDGDKATLHVRSAQGYDHMTATATLGTRR